MPLNHHKPIKGEITDKFFSYIVSSTRESEDWVYNTFKGYLRDNSTFSVLQIAEMCSVTVHSISRVITQLRRDFLNDTKKMYSREEVRIMLEEMYCETAGSYNDYGKHAHDYDGTEVVREYLKNK